MRYILTPMPRTKAILEKLKKLRAAKDLRQGEMASRLGINRTTYVRKELGIIPITTGEWLRIADIMGKDPAYFFDCAVSRTRKTDRNRGMYLTDLYKSLQGRRKNDFICGINFMCKNIKRKEVRDALAMLNKY